jgi:hypothetical protein
VSSYDPEKRRKQSRARYERLRADPEKYEAFLAKQRESRRQRKAAGIAVVPRGVKTVEKIRESSRIYKLTDGVKRQRRNYEREKMDRMATRPRPEVCEVCHTVGARGVVFDHCHETDTFRGWLCDNCNRALGLLNDDLERLLGLALYVENHNRQVRESRRIPSNTGEVTA